MVICSLSFVLFGFVYSQLNKELKIQNYWLEWDLTLAGDNRNTTIS